MADYIFKELSNLHLFSWLSFFLFSGYQQNIRPTQHHIWAVSQQHKCADCSYCFPISNCSNANIFLNEDNFCSFSDCRNTFNDKLKKIITIILFTLTQQMHCMNPDRYKSVKRQKFFQYMISFLCYLPILTFCWP